MLNKQINHAFSKDIYFLGQDSEGINYWLEAGTWDCDWYWGFGYIKTYTNNTNPEKARDINSQQHFSGLIFGGEKSAFDNYKKFFKKSPLTDNELWTLCELMKTFYTLREYSDTLNRGGSHYTNNPCCDIIKNDDEYNRINKEVIPAIMQEVYKLLSPAE